eukprot:CAMPEP_0194740062 /NCGR_PEP_ID=MMETSP0296-20130528/90912_1 /TAXON_ID=39354 /ORGANISM="Heterosigma akashiwo, Strain CCMP2393" /LENGTH=99 /DNA_ID=CAMNT_0039651049 /DNA_START=42 /DNA_END=337 /DNA_ORIENTATION=-
MMVYTLNGYSMSPRLEVLINGRGSLDVLGHNFGRGSFRSGRHEYKSTAQWNKEEQTTRFTLLMMAAALGNDPETIGKVIDAGASLSVVNEEGETALTLA